jgi:hypothetical protein
MAQSFVYLTDSSGAVWQVGIGTDGRLNQTVATGAPGSGTPPSVSSYTPNDALALVKTFAHGTPMDTPTQANLCDMINSMIWTFYPWSWTISSFTPITLADSVQDFAPSNSDILRPLKTRLVRTDISPNEYREMALLGNLGVELSRKGGLDSIQSVGWLAGSNIFRLDLCVQMTSPTVLQLQGEYQKRPTRITDGRLSVAFPFPDHFFNTFVEGLKWKIYQLSDDPRAGGISIAKNGTMQRQYTGQFGVFWEQLLQMARTEDLSVGDEFMFPEIGLGVGRQYWPGIGAI